MCPIILTLVFHGSRLALVAQTALPGARKSGSFPAFGADAAELPLMLRCQMLSKHLVGGRKMRLLVPRHQVCHLTARSYPELEPD